MSDDDKKDKKEMEEELKAARPLSQPGQNPYPDKEEWGSKNPPPPEYQWPKGTDVSKKFEDSDKDKKDDDKE